MAAGRFVYIPRDGETSSDGIAAMCVKNTTMWETKCGVLINNTSQSSFSVFTATANLRLSLLWHRTFESVSGLHHCT